MGTGQMLMVILSVALFMGIANNVNRAKVESTNFVIENQLLNDAMAYGQAIIDEAFPVDFDDLTPRFHNKQKNEVFGADKLNVKTQVYYADPSSPTLISNHTTDFKVLMLEIFDDDRKVTITLDHIFARKEGQ